MTLISYFITCSSLIHDEKYITAKKLHKVNEMEQLFNYCAALETIYYGFVSLFCDKIISSGVHMCIIDSQIH
jgi:restriction endonuclease Mrr